MSQFRFLHASWLFACTTLLASCASEVQRQHTELHRTAPPAARHFVLTTAAEFRLETGYSRMLGGGTELVEVGEIDRGVVLRPVNTVLTVEGAHVHEAYLVLHEQQVVGFYLPVEQAFSLLPKPATISIEERTR